MRYGHIVNGQLIVVKQKGEDDKPIVYSAPPETGIHEKAVFNYEDNGEQITQVWSIVATQDEPIDDLSDEEALSILLGGESE